MKEEMNLINTPKSHGRSREPGRMTALLACSCQQFREWRSAYLDGEIGEWRRTMFELHLRACGDCREALLREDGSEETARLPAYLLPEMRGARHTLRFDPPIAPLLPRFERQLRTSAPPTGADVSDKWARNRQTQEQYLRAKIEELPEGYRIVLQLHDIQGMSIRQVAEKLGLAELSVRLRLHKARSALTGMCQPLFEGDA